VALALAAELPGAEVWATDISPAALAVARANLTALAPPAASRVHFAEVMWYEALPAGLRGRLRVIVSNPPYVTEAEFAGLPAEVRDHEPTGALVAGGLDWLEPGGSLVLELAPDQATPLVAAAEAAGYDGVAVHRDLAGRDRVLALSGNDDVTSACDALRAGADGFLLKSSEPDELVPPLIALASGVAVVPAPGMHAQLDAKASSGETRLAGLCAEDIGLLRLVAAGLESIEIAETLHVSERTAKRMVAALLRRIEVANRVQAAAFAGRAGILEIGPSGPPPTP
jgi:DNA-binding NarL/FixJ family response regulator